MTTPINPTAGRRAERLACPRWRIVKVAGWRAGNFPGRRAGSIARESDLCRGRKPRHCRGLRDRESATKGPKGAQAARNALHHRRALNGHGMGRKGRADHRRAVLGRNPRLLASAMSARKPPNAVPIALVRGMGDIIKHRTPKRAVSSLKWPKTCWPSKPQGVAAAHHRLPIGGALWRYQQVVGLGALWRGHPSPSQPEKPPMSLADI